MMQLTIIKGFEVKEERVIQVNSWNKIEQVFDEIDWEEFHIFTLERENNSSCDISGNINLDGLSASLSYRGEFHVIEEAPENLQFAKRILKEFYIDENRAFERYFSKKKIFPKVPKRSSNKYFGIFMLVFFFSIIMVPFYFLYKDDLKFLGRGDISYARAIVVDIKIQNYGGRFFFQKVTYEFKTDHGVFEGEFLGGKRQGYSKVGDELKIRYLNSDPTVSDYEGRFIKVNHRRNSSIFAKTRKSKLDSLKMKKDSISEIQYMDTVFIH